jgi:cell division protein FtsW
VDLKLNIKGDYTLWVLTSILAIAGTLTVYSASSNLAFSGGGSTFMDLGKHLFFLSAGFLIMYLVHRVDYNLFGSFSRLLLLPVVILLVYTLFNGVNISNASRWIRLPMGQTFQTSALASVVLITYLARYLALKTKEELRSFKGTFLPLISPIILVVGLILPANFSTAALIFGVSFLLLFMGGYAIKNLIILGGSAIVFLTLFVALVYAFPNISNRLETWRTRIESFQSGDSAENYQVTKAKMAIAEGQYIGKGPGKSALKNFLPQSNSDFIFAVIVEEWGTIGGTLIIVVFIWIPFRFLRIANKAKTSFGSLLSLGLGLVIMAQALVNLSVAVNLIPVTGQTLPLVSKGGTSIWMTAIALGMVQSVSRGKSQSNSSLDDEDLNGTSGFTENDLLNPEKLSHV